MASWLPARLGVHAHPAGLTVEVRERGVEHLHVDGADVAADPILEHIDQEPPVLHRADRAVGDQVPLLGVERAALHPAAPAGVGDRQTLLGRAFDDGNELDEPRAQLVAQERVHLAAVVAVDRVDGGQHVPVDLVAPQHIQAPHHPVERRLAALVHAVGIVHLPRPVDRDADQEVVLLQERAPLVIEQGAVRLDRVEDPLARRGVLAFQLDRPPEEIQAHHRGLAALPGDHHLRGPRVALEQLTDIRLLQVFGHPEPAARIQHLLGQEEAVLAIQVADRARGLGHHVEGQRSPRHGQDRAGGLGGMIHSAPRVYSRASMAWASRSRST